MPEFSSLEDVRLRIDELDRSLVQILGERAGCVAAAGRFKSSEAEVRAADRLAAMIAERRTWAHDAGLDANFVENLFRAITAHFIADELQQWRGNAPPHA